MDFCSSGRLLCAIETHWDLEDAVYHRSLCDVFENDDLAAMERKFLDIAHQPIKFEIGLALLRKYKPLSCC